jgi:hypothetical protein
MVLGSFIKKLDHMCLRNLEYDLGEPSVPPPFLWIEHWVCSKHQTSLSCDYLQFGGKDYYFFFQKKKRPCLPHRKLLHLYWGPIVAIQYFTPNFWQRSFWASSSPIFLASNIDYAMSGIQWFNYFMKVVQNSCEIATFYKIHESLQYLYTSEPQNAIG